MEVNFNSADLIRQHANLSAEMSEAINAGDVGRMVRIDAQMKTLPPRIFAAQLAELKKDLEENERQRAEVESQIEALSQIRDERARKLARAAKLHQRRGEASIRADYALHIAENELEQVRRNRRNLGDKIRELKNAKLREQEKENERFRETIYGIGN